MPFLAQESLYLSFLEQIRGTLDTMTGFVLYYLTAFLASSTVLPSNDGIKGVAGQYLLGLGELLSVILRISSHFGKSRNRRYHWVTSASNTQMQLANHSPSPVVETNMMVCACLNPPQNPQSQLLSRATPV